MIQDEKNTAFLLATITLLAGVYIGYTNKDGVNTNMLLGLLMIGNAFLTISTFKGNKE